MKKSLTVLVSAALLLGTVSVAHASGRGADEDHTIASDLAQLRQSTAQYRRISTALADGYAAFAIPPSVGGESTVGLGLPGDPSCFDDPAGGMGVHYVKGIDATLDITQPEALVYQVGEKGRLRLVAVEYIVPDVFVDPADPPTLFGMHLHHHPYLPVYVLHVWAWRHNPSGVFADWNPEVAPCPTL